MAYGRGFYGNALYGRSIRLGAVSLASAGALALAPSIQINGQLDVVAHSVITAVAKRVRVSAFSTSGQTYIEATGERVRPPVFPDLTAFSLMTVNASRIVGFSQTFAGHSVMTANGRGIYVTIDAPADTWAPVAVSPDIWTPVPDNSDTWLEVPANA